MLRAYSITHDYADFRALKDVSIDIFSGEIVGLLGKNGAGKSTLMRVLTGFMHPTAGKVYLDGDELWQGNNNSIQGKIGYLPENNVIYDEMSVLDYLLFVADIRGVSKKERLRFLSEAVNKTGLDAKLGVSMFELSRGFKQRVGIAQALIHQPRILILDEPTNGLDPSQVLQIRNLIRDLKTAKIAVLVSTHILNEVEALCDRVVVLDSGKKILDQEMDEFVSTRKINLIVNKLPQALLSFFDNSSIIENVETMNRSEKKKQILITIKSGNDLDQEIATIVRQTVQSGAEIYEISPDHRGLELIFNKPREERENTRA